MKTAALFIFHLFAISIIAVAQSDVGLPKLMEKLETHSIHYDSYQRYNFPLLLGNSEMGSLADPMGRGFHEMWLSDYWSDSTSRAALPGLMIRSINFEGLTPIEYSQNLSLVDGVLKTKVLFENGEGYESEMFLSMDDQRLFAIKIKNIGKKPFLNQLKLPYNHTIIQKDEYSLQAENDPGSFTGLAWALNCNQKLILRSGTFCRLSIMPGDSLICIYSIATVWDGDNYKTGCYSQIPSPDSFEELKEKNHKAWVDIWKNTAAIILPEGQFAHVYYTSLFWLYCTSGSKHFLPGETQFASFTSDMALDYGFYSEESKYDIPIWGMAPFTYGGAGWSAMAFNTIGNEEKARNVLNWFYKPAALKLNVNTFPIGKKTVSYRGDTLGEFTYLNKKNENAFYFGHTLDYMGRNIISLTDDHWDWQTHINAFGTSFFHQYSENFPDDKAMMEKTYKIMKGTAEFWSELLNWDDRLKSYVCPPVLSYSEDLFNENIIEGAISAKWCLMIASRYAKQSGRDDLLSEKWGKIAEKVHVNQNDMHYLEWLRDDEKRISRGYNGIRGFAFLGYPVEELIPYFDSLKVSNTLDYTWKRNNFGDGMITFVADWDGITEAYYGRGDKALERLSVSFKELDTLGNVMFEANKGRPYYLDSYAAFTIATAAMLLQSYNDKIIPFPAVPGEWKDVEFYNLPAAGGIRVSGRMSGGRVSWVRYYKNGKEMPDLRTDNRAKTVVIK